MFRLLYPLRYLDLRDQRKRRLVRRDVPAVVVIGVIVAVPFIVLDANYFGPDGFLARFGSFSSVLTGFYIAALVGIATYKSVVGALDDPIQVGPVYRPSDFDIPEDEERIGLTRREYVCSMFGYLAFISLAVSMIAIVAVIVAVPLHNLVEGLASYSQPVLFWLPATFVVAFSTVVAHMIVTTCYGLYYLIDRLYAEPMKIVQPDETGKTQA